MKKSTSLIIEKLPYLEKQLNQLKEEGTLEDCLNELNTPMDKTFMKMIAYFEYPDHYPFSIQDITNLQDEWLEIALSCFTTYFYKDTYLIKDPKISFIKEDEQLYNQSDFAKKLTDSGLKYDRTKVHMYYKRGLIPPADVTLKGKPYWYASSVDNYIKASK